MSGRRKIQNIHTLWFTLQALQPTLQNAGAGVTALQRCKMKREMKRNTGLFLLALGVKECLGVECRISSSPGAWTW